MAEIAYLYVHNIKRNIFNQSINFSNRFEFSFIDGNLHIINKNIIPKNFWGENISNITLLIGKNGVGKTSILDLIGFNEKTRTANYSRGKFFIIYHVIDNIFYFEGTMKNEIKNIDGKIGGNKQFYFTYQDGKLLTIGLSKTDFLKIYYQRVETSLPWAAEKKIYTQNQTQILRYSQFKSTPKDIMNFVRNINFLKDKQRAVIISQKEYYTNKPYQLFGLYHYKEDVEKSLNLNYFNKELFPDSYYYKRKYQDSFFDKSTNRKYYFILRLFEKHFLNNLNLIFNLNNNKTKKQFNLINIVSNNSNSSETFNYEEYQSTLINHIIQSRNYDYDLRKNDNPVDILKELQLKIEYLIYVNQYLANNLYYNNLIKEFIDFKSLYNNLNNLGDKLFLTKNAIEIPVTSDFNGENLLFLNKVLEEYKSLFNLKFNNFSDGEYIYLNLFTNIYSMLIDSKNDNCLILLDEPDINLHPEWSRNFINNLVNLIKKYKTKGEVQVILTTHSPFMSTDFPKNNIYAFVGEKEIKINKINFGFAANIYDIISDTFFMNLPIGQFSYNKIKSLRFPLEEYSLKDKIEIIDLIDDDFMKKQLKKEFNITTDLDGDPNNDKN